MSPAVLRSLGLACVAVGCTSAATGTPTLCEVAANREAYAAQIITVEGLLHVSRHGSSIGDPACGQGIPIEWYETDGLPELDAVADRALAQPIAVRIRVTGEMKRGEGSPLLNLPYWYLRLGSAEVLDAPPPR